MCVCVRERESVYKCVCECVCRTREDDVNQKNSTPVLSDDGLGDQVTERD